MFQLSNIMKTLVHNLDLIKIPTADIGDETGVRKTLGKQNSLQNFLFSVLDQELYQNNFKDAPFLPKIYIAYICNKV